MRVLIKRSAEYVLARSGLLRVARARHRTGTLVLAYHNIAPHGEPVAGDGSLHLSQAAFARQLDILCETHDVVSLADMASAPKVSERPRAVITFDDAYQGALTAGLEELRRRRLPATYFIAPDFVGGRSFWWDELAGAHDGGLPPELRRFAIEDLGGKHAKVREWAAGANLPLCQPPEHETAATEAQIKAADDSGLVMLGSHSWSHANLTRLNETELRRELTESMQWLQRRFTAVVPFLSYPYGSSSPQVHAETERAGYSGAFAIDGGWLFGSSFGRRFDLPRVNVPAGISATGYRILASGLLPFRSRPLQPA